MAGVSIANGTRRRTPRLPFAEVAEATLPGWDLSLVFVDPTQARRLNKKLRRKTYTPNVLSYQVGKRHGEILICLDVVQKQAPSYHLPPTTYCLFLFIHGCLHLKGGRHGTTMERREQMLLARYGGHTKK